jgi:hypothetical protein
MLAPSARSQSLPGWAGGGGVVDTLKTGYPHMQALCQDEGQDGQLRNRHVSRGSSSCLPTQYSSRAATCLMAPTPTSRLRASPEPPRVPWGVLRAVGH